MTDGHDDWIRARVKARALELQLTSYAIAKASGVSENHVAAYLAGRKSMTSSRLQHVLAALGLSVETQARQQAAKGSEVRT
jgi:transcriptional regulator with XRE-family HTH domain